MTTPAQILEYTNYRLTKWYENAKREYGVIGQATADYVEGSIVIEAVEDGEALNFVMPLYSDELPYLKQDFVFNHWMENPSNTF